RHMHFNLLKRGDNMRGDGATTSKIHVVIPSRIDAATIDFILSKEICVFVRVRIGVSIGIWAVRFRIAIYYCCVSVLADDNATWSPMPIPCTDAEPRRIEHGNVNVGDAAVPSSDNHTTHN